MRRFLIRTCVYAAVFAAIILLREVPMALSGHYADVPIDKIVARVLTAFAAVIALGALIAWLEQLFSKFRSK